MTYTQLTNKRWYNPLKAVVDGFLAWLIFLRATDTGSLWQWALVIVFLVSCMYHLIGTLKQLSAKK